MVSQTPVHQSPTIAVSVFFPRNARIDPTTQQLIDETCTCRNAGTLATGWLDILYWEWHLIPRWLLRSIFGRFLDQLLKGFVSWGRPDEYFMIDPVLLWSTIGLLMRLLRAEPRSAAPCLFSYHDLSVHGMVFATLCSMVWAWQIFDDSMVRDIKW